MSGAREATLFFVHSGSAGGLVQRAAIGEPAAAAFSSVTVGTWAMGTDLAGSGSPDAVAGPSEARVLDGYNQVLAQPLEP